MSNPNRRKFLPAAAVALCMTGCAQSRRDDSGPEFRGGMVVVLRLAPGAAEKMGLVGATDTGQEIFGSAVLSSRNSETNSFGSLTRSIPRWVQVTWRERLPSQPENKLQMTTVVTKLDARTWQYRSTTVEQLGGAPGALPDFAMQRKMFAQSAKNGATPEDRADAAAMLAHWDDYVADARGAASEAAQAPRRVEQRSATSVTRFTRIADNCSTTSRKQGFR